jgi:hypothetical protein
MIGYSDDGVKDASSGVYFMSYGNSIVNGKRKLHTGEERLHRKLVIYIWIDVNLFGWENV